MKKWIALLLAVCMLAGFTACGAEPDTPAGSTGASEPIADTSADAPSDTAAEPSTGAYVDYSAFLDIQEDDVEFLTPTEEDLEKLGYKTFGSETDRTDILTDLCFELFSTDSENPKHHYTHFDSRDLDSRHAGYNMFFFGDCYDYTRYFGPQEEVSAAEIAEVFPDYDGEGWVGKYREKAISWIANNVWNLPGSLDPEEVAAGQNESDIISCRYQNGYYYFEVGVFGIEEYIEAKIKSYEPFGDHLYKFTVEYQFNDIGKIIPITGEGTLIAGLKQIDGKRVWSVYAYDADIYIA